MNFTGEPVGGAFGEMPLATDAAKGEAGEGIEHAQEVQWIGADGCAKAFRADLGDGFADQGGSELVGGGIGIDA